MGPTPSIAPSTLNVIEPGQSNEISDQAAVENMVVDSEVTAISDSENCCICRDAVTTQEKAVLVPCNHQYHKACIDEWFKTSGANRICCYCRTPSSQIRYGFQNNASIRTENFHVVPQPNRTTANNRRLRFLMCVITERVYLYTLSTEAYFTIVNSSDRTIELVDDNYQLVNTVLPGSQQRLTETTLNYNIRFEDEPQIEFTLFNVDSFFYGSVLVNTHSTAAEASAILRAELVNIESQRNERLAVDRHEENDDDIETPRMRRRRERSERVSRAQPRTRRRGGRRGGRRGDDTMTQN